MVSVDYHLGTQMTVGGAGWGGVVILRRLEDVVMSGVLKKIRVAGYH